MLVTVTSPLSLVYVLMMWFILLTAFLVFQRGRERILPSWTEFPGVYNCFSQATLGQYIARICVKVPYIYSNSIENFLKWLTILDIKLKPLIKVSTLHNLSVLCKPNCTFHPSLKEKISCLLWRWKTLVVV